jgi:PD-(D/E)XK nuclease superfamily
LVVTPGEVSAVQADQGEAKGDVSSPASPLPGTTEGTKRLSWSRLSSYSRCGESFRLSYVEQIPRAPSGAAMAGTAVHRVGEQLAKTGLFQDPFYVEGVAATAAVQLFTELVEEAGGPDVCMWGGRKRNLKDERTGKDVLDDEGNKVKVGEDFRWMVQTIPTWVKRLGTILRRDIEHGLYIVEANVERQVTVWLIPPESDERMPDGVQVTGFIDTMLLANDYGMPIVRDVKTGTLLDEMQLAVYAWLLEQLDEPAKVNTTIGQFAYLRGADSGSWIKEHDLTLLKPIVPQLFDGLLKGIAAEVFTLSPSSFCGSCWVRHGCVYGKTLDERKEG